MRKRRKVNTTILLQDLLLRKEKKITMQEVASKHHISRARIYKFIIDNNRQDLLSKAGRITDIDFE